MEHTSIDHQKIHDMLKQQIAALKSGKISLLVVPVELAFAANVAMIKLLQEKNYMGIYISLSKGYSELAPLLEKEGIDTKKLYFIDGLTHMYGMAKVEQTNVIYINTPISVSKVFEHVKEISNTLKDSHKFIFLDSITTILLYNSLERTLSFAQHFADSFKDSNLLNIFVSVSREIMNDPLIEELKQISDKVVDLNALKEIT